MHWKDIKIPVSKLQFQHMQNVSCTSNLSFFKHVCQKLKLM